MIVMIKMLHRFVHVGWISATCRTLEKASRENILKKNWMSRDRLRTGVGRHRSPMKKWRLTDSASCQCGITKEEPCNVLFD